MSLEFVIGIRPPAGLLFFLSFVFALWALLTDVHKRHIDHIFDLLDTACVAPARRENLEFIRLLHQAYHLASEAHVAAQERADLDSTGDPLLQGHAEETARHRELIVGVIAATPARSIGGIWAKLIFADDMGEWSEKVAREKRPTFDATVIVALLRDLEQIMAKAA